MTSNQITLSSQNAIVIKAEEINQLHALAFSKAEEAIDFAKKAGQLLIEVKGCLKHGQFQSWIETHCQFSVRQAQRYMTVALNKSVSTQELFLKNDTMSHLKPPSTKSEGIWKDGNWKPERGCVYLFNDAEGSAYWVTPSNHDIPHFHICKHYSGLPMSTKGFYVGYTKFGKNDHEDLTSEFYVGTRNPLLAASGVAEVLKSYGLKDIKKSLVSGKVTSNRYERPFGEPNTEHSYLEDSCAGDALNLLQETDGGGSRSSQPLTHPGTHTVS